MLNCEIKTKRTLLRKYKEEDRAEFIRILIDPEVNHFMGGRTEDPEEAGKIFNKIFDIYNSKSPERPFEIWAIEHEGKFTGDFELKQTENTADNELEVVYLLDKAHWGKGLIPEILKEIIRYAGKMGKQVIATLNPDNIKTVRALEKAGIDKQEWVGKGENRCFKVWLKR